jgi:hypothetical protein
MPGLTFLVGTQRDRLHATRPDIRCGPSRSPPNSHHRCLEAQSWAPIGVSTARLAHRGSLDSRSLACVGCELCRRECVPAGAGAEATKMPSRIHERAGASAFGTSSEIAAFGTMAYASRRHPRDQRGPGLDRHSCRLSANLVASAPSNRVLSRPDGSDVLTKRTGTQTRRDGAPRPNAGAATELGKNPQDYAVRRISLCFGDIRPCG